MSQDISNELGVTDRPEEHVGEEEGATEVDRDAFAEGHHQEISTEDKGGDQNSDIKTKCLDTTDLARSENPHTGDRSSEQRSGAGEKRNEKGSITDETDEVHMESIGGRETVCNPYPLHRKDMDPAKDEHLPQTNGSDTGQWDDQYRDSKGQDGASQRSVRDQNMDTNADDSRDMSEWGEKKCSDTSGGLILAEEEQWIVDRSNRATIVMDTEADNANVPKNEDSDLQLGLGEDEGAPERGLSSMDRDRTRENGSEMETALPRDLDIPSRDRYLQTGVDPMQGKETGGRPDDAASEVNTTTDSAQKLHNNKLNPRLDSGENEKGIDRKQVREREAGEPL